jgi:hypothetical protein
VAYADTIADSLAGGLDDNEIAIVPVVIRGAWVSFLRSTFSNSSSTLAVIPTIGADGGSSVRLEDTIFQEPRSRRLLQAFPSGATFFSDNRSVSVWEGPATDAAIEAGAPKTLAAAAQKDKWLIPDDIYIKNLQKVAFLTLFRSPILFTLKAF